MAELLLTDPLTAVDSASAYLREALPDDFVVVASPVVCQRPMDALVVGPAGLTIISGDAARGAASDAKNRADSDAVRKFLHDEFPAIKPDIRCVRIAPETSHGYTVWKAMTLTGAQDQSLVDALLAGDGAAAHWADADLRRAVAVALHERRLTVDGRASKPFVFRSGGPFRGGARVWTIRGAVRQMDRFPEVGVHHLRDGTLAAWLAEVGAPHLARLARGAVSQAKTDLHAALETFLLGTGLVKRPRLRIRPRVVNLGYVLQGQICGHTAHVRKGRGRGYLFGELATCQPWLHVTPASFKGNAGDAVVSADTDALPISPQPYTAEIILRSSASEELATVPVRLRVVAHPPPLTYLVLRPLVAMVLAGLAGGGLGWLLGRTVIPTPVLPVVGRPAPQLFWAGLLALIWALLGLARGILQPRAWPTFYATGRWLVRTCAWALGLAMLAVAAVWSSNLGFRGRTPDYIALYRAAVTGCALAVFPAVLGEIITARRLASPVVAYRPRPWGRAVAVSAVIGLVLVGTLLAPRALGPEIVRLEKQGAFKDAGARLGYAWDRANNGMNDLIDRLMLRAYDRRAPAAPTPTLAVPTSAAPGEGE